jgi:hypothetical protein
MKKVLLLLIAVAGAYYAFEQQQPAVERGTAQIAIEAPVAQTAEQWRSGQQVRGMGVVSRILSDDSESNSQGGVIHWTHNDPQGRHTAGWLEHNGRRYQ